MWVVALDNLSGVPDWLSDGLCRISTGAGYSARKLYFDLEETFAKTQRPVILNGIPELVSRGDLQDRSIVITLPAISDLQRRSKADILSAFRSRLPILLGQVFDAVSAAIRLKDVTTINLAGCREWPILHSGQRGVVWLLHGTAERNF